MVDDEFIQMKDGSFFTNTARGELVNEDRILKAPLEQRKLKRRIFY